MDPQLASIRAVQVPPGALNYIDQGCSIAARSRSYLISRLWSSELPPSASPDKRPYKDQQSARRAVGGPAMALTPNGGLIVGRKNSVDVYGWREASKESPSCSPSSSKQPSKSKSSSPAGYYRLHHFGDLKNCHRVLKVLPLSCRHVVVVFETTDERSVDVRRLNLPSISTSASTPNSPKAFTCPTTMALSSVPGDTAFCALSDDETGKIYIYSAESCSLKHTFQSKVVNGKCVFDLVGDWLVYVEPSGSSSSAAPAITELAVSSRPALYRKLLGGLSSTAIDTFSMFAEVSQYKLSKMLKGSEKADGQDSPEAVKRYREMLCKLYKTMSTGESVVSVIDLKTGTRLFSFKPPQGCSKISLSPCDMRLCTASTRGDLLSLWDFTCYNRHIDLVDQYLRGKTACAIEDVVWLPKSKGIVTLTRQSGSLHYFEDETVADEEQETDSAAATGWWLSDLGVSQIVLRDNVLCCLRGSTQLCIDMDNRNNAWLFELDGADAAESAKSKPFEAYFGTPGTRTFDDSSDSASPMDHVVIETCKPLPALYHSRQAHFALAASGDPNLLHFGDCLGVSYEDEPVGANLHLQAVSFIDEEAAKLGRLELDGEGGEKREGQK